jgi:hypothetical protein
VESIDVNCFTLVHCRPGDGPAIMDGMVESPADLPRMTLGRLRPQRQRAARRAGVHARRCQRDLHPAARPHLADQRRRPARPRRPHLGPHAHPARHAAAVRHHHAGPRPVRRRGRPAADQLPRDGRARDAGPADPAHRREAHPDPLAPAAPGHRRCRVRPVRRRGQPARRHPARRRRPADPVRRALLRPLLPRWTRLPVAARTSPSSSTRSPTPPPMPRRTPAACSPSPSTSARACEPAGSSPPGRR